MGTCNCWNPKRDCATCGVDLLPLIKKSFDQENWLKLVEENKYEGFDSIELC